MAQEGHQHREVRLAISREKARQFLQDFVNDEEFRERLQREPRTVLFESRIDLTPESLPEEVTLPSPEAVSQLLELAEAMTEESASPFGFIVLFVVFGAMPIVTTPRP
jgi:hypothetical protein